jgi:hypothetical protein
MSFRVQHFSTTVCMAVFVACAEPPPADDEEGVEPTCTSGNAQVEVGAGADAFEEISDGAELPLIHGPQGGNHVLASVRVHNMDPIVSIHYTLTRLSDDAVFSDNLYRLHLLEEGECQYYYPGLYGYVGFTGELQDTNYDLGQIIMEECELSMEVTDRNGGIASDSVVILPVNFDDPVDTALDSTE